MGNLAGFQRGTLSHPHQSKVKKISEVFPKQTDFSVYCPSFWFGHSSLGVYKGGQGSETHTKVVKEVKLMAPTRGTRSHQYLVDWLLRALCQETYRHTRTLLALCSELRWVAKMKKSELTPQQDYYFLNDLKNYRPVSGLCFLSKLVEQVVAKQLTSHINNKLDNQHQSAYKPGHSTETALLSIKNEVHLSGTRRTYGPSY